MSLSSWHFSHKQTSYAIGSAGIRRCYFCINLRHGGGIIRNGRFSIFSKHGTITAGLLETDVTDEDKAAIAELFEKEGL